MDEKSYKYNPSHEWWTEMSTLIKAVTETVKQQKTRGAPYETNRGRVVSQLELDANREAIRKAEENDKKKFVDRRKGKKRHGGSPR